jgi:hypothetical protein
LGLACQRHLLPGAYVPLLGTRRLRYFLPPPPPTRPARPPPAPCSVLRLVPKAHRLKTLHSVQVPAAVALQCPGISIRCSCLHQSNSARHPPYAPPTRAGFAKQHRLHTLSRRPAWLLGVVIRAVSSAVLRARPYLFFLLTRLGRASARATAQKKRGMACTCSWSARECSSPCRSPCSCSSGARECSSPCRSPCSCFFFCSSPFFFRTPRASARTAARATAPARAPEEQVQGLRHGPLPARAPEATVQGLRQANRQLGNRQLGNRQ